MVSVIGGFYDFILEGFSRFPRAEIPIKEGKTIEAGPYALEQAMP
jgi:hypothetical protein